MIKKRIKIQRYPQKSPNKLFRIFKNEIDLGSIILGILGIIVTFLITRIQFNFSQEIENFRLQSSLQIEQLRTQIAERQLDISRSQTATSLIPSLIKGAESERIMAMILLEKVGDSAFSTKIFQGLALYDPKVEIRLQAIRALGRQSGSAIKPILTNIEKQGKTPKEREAARTAKDNVSFREYLINAQVFYKIEKWRAASEQYKNADDVVDRAQLAQEDENNLKDAKFYYNRGSYEEAAKKYMEVFSKFY